jgi:hypothetical protein
MLAHSPQRFGLVYVGNKTISVVIGIMEFSKAVVMSRTINPSVVNSNFLNGLNVIVHNHFPSAYNGHLSHFSRFQPTALDGCELTGLKAQRQVGYVLDSWRDMGIPLAIDKIRSSTE